jgi:hypothetical protein
MGYIAVIAPAGNGLEDFNQARADMQRAAARFQPESVLNV